MKNKNSQHYHSGSNIVTFTCDVFNLEKNTHWYCIVQDALYVIINISIHRILTGLQDMCVSRNQCKCFGKLRYLNHKGKTVWSSHLYCTKHQTLNKPAMLLD